MWVALARRRMNGGMYVTAYEADGNGRGPAIVTDFVATPTPEDAVLAVLERNGFQSIEVTGRADENVGGFIWFSGMAERKTDGCP